MLDTFSDESTARLFVDVLFAQGIHSTIRPGQNGSLVLWVHEEDRMDDAKKMLAAFDADDSRFREVAKFAREKKHRQQAEYNKLERRTEKIKREMQARNQNRVGPVTIGLIAISVIFFFLTQMGGDREMVARFTLNKIVMIGPNTLGFSGLSILETEPWRLLTPMFLHFGFLHIFFNLWWMKDLGTIIERQFSSKYLLTMVLTIAVVSHLAQYFLSGPSIFGGMSGVVYGLFSFMWIRGRFDSRFPYRIPQNLVVFMLIWFALGFTGQIGPIANAVHAGGLVVGAIWGFVSSGWLTRR